MSFRTFFMAATVAMASPTLAQPVQAEQRAVRFKDLDLATPRGARLMFSRIDAAALEICGGGRTSLDPVKRAMRRTDCWQEAAAEAVARLNAPAVTAVWRKTTGSQSPAISPAPHTDQDR